MINLIEVRTPQGDLLTLSLLDLTSGIQVQNIDGLDPVDATITTSNYASRDGVQYQNSARGSRNIVITLGLRPDYLTSSVRAIRNQLYAYFLPKAVVSLRFYMDDGLIVDTTGRVETFVAPMFTNDPKATISIICDDPDFSGTTPVVVSGSTVSSTVTTLVEYDGTTETGFTFVLNVNRDDLSEFTIYNRTADGTVSSLDFAMSLDSGDTVTISTIDGNKVVELTRSGVVNSVLYAVPIQSSWVKLEPGDNHIRVYATGAAVPFTITYNELYGGL